MEITRVTDLNVIVCTYRFKRILNQIDFFILPELRKQSRANFKIQNGLWAYIDYQIMNPIIEIIIHLD